MIRPTITPTPRAVWAAVAATPLALLAAVLLPRAPYTSLALPALLLLAIAADALLAARAGRAALTLKAPRIAPVGGDADVRIDLRFAGPRPPAWCEIALDADPLLASPNGGRVMLPIDGSEGSGLFPVYTVRRGTARLAQSWVRWMGPLGLAWRQARFASDATIAILPDVRPVHEQGARLFERHAIHGLLAQLNRGDGTEFDALVEYQPGMDVRAIDWKQSARHRKLYAKEYRSERNSQIVFAVDCGREMSEPVAGLPLIDRAVSAMLLTAWIVLRLGDRVALHAFDGQPRIASAPIGGKGAFAELQSLAARIDYSARETNFTLALTTLDRALKRRSMVVLFTEFADLSSAEFLVRAAARLVETHLLLIVVVRNEELEAIAAAAPDAPEDVTRAVTAAALLRKRQVVLRKLRHLGVHIVETVYSDIGERLVAAYVDLKRRNLL